MRAQAIEEVARACRLPYLLLCSTDDPDVKATWTALGFLFTTEEVRAYTAKPKEKKSWNTAENIVGSPPYITCTSMAHLRALSSAGPAIPAAAPRSCVAAPSAAFDAASIPAEGTARGSAP